MQGESQLASSILHTFASNEWELHLYGDFRLLNQAGNIVRFPTRKVEGLLAVLALNRRFGVERDELGDILWPGRLIDAQRTSFRQTLSQLRKLTGDLSIESSRTHCRLSSNFSLRCDYDDVTLRSSGGFMPGQEGEWFEQIRAETLEDSDEESIAPLTVVSTFTHTLQWFAANDHKGLFALLRASKSLTRGIAPNELLPMLQLAEPNGVHAGWLAYWRGCSEDNLPQCAVILEGALREAKRTSDRELASEVCLELGKVYSRIGRLEDAKRMLSTADAIAESQGTREARANAMRLKGTVFVHWGEAKRGLHLMAKSEDLIDDPLDRATLSGARAFFAASAGLDHDAERTLELPLKLLEGSGHRRLGILCSLTQCLLEARGSGIRSIHNQLEGLSSQLYKYGWSQFSVYTDEILAKAFNLSGDKDLASIRLKAAAKGRRGASMVRTPLEVKLLETVG